MPELIAVGSLERDASRELLLLIAVVEQRAGRHPSREVARGLALLYSAADEFVAMAPRSAAQPAARPDPSY